MPDYYQPPEATPVTFEKRTGFTNSAAPYTIYSIALQPGDGGRVVLDVIGMDMATATRVYYYWYAEFGRPLTGVIPTPVLTPIRTVEPAGYTACNLTAVVVGNTVEFRIVPIAGKNFIWQLVTDANIIQFPVSGNEV